MFQILKKIKINFLNFAIYFLITAVFLFLQSGRFLDIKNIAPNLIILDWLVIVMLAAKRYHWWTALACLAFLVLFSYWQEPFFWKQWFLWGTIIAPIIFLHSKLTGNFYIDFVVWLLVAIFAFYFLNNKFSFNFDLFRIILAELIYDIFIGIVLIFFFKKIVSNESPT